MTALPSYDDLRRRTDAPAGSSWGVWGDDDVFGTLNLLTADTALRGVACVRRGRVFNLDLPLELPDPPLYRRAALRHEVTGSGLSCDDELHEFKTQSSTQWDGFRHVRHPVHGWYNGLDGNAHGVHHWARRGIVTRGVLADVGRWRSAQGRPISCGSADVIEAAEIAEALDAQHTVVEPGDILLVRTGWVGWYRDLTGDQREEVAAEQLSPSCGVRAGEEIAALLWDLHIAAVAGDSPAFEVVPFGGITDPARLRDAFRDPGRAEDTFVHFRLLALLGIPIGEMWDLEALAGDCAADGVYEFLLTSSPLNLHQGVGSPPNALAVK